MNSPRRQFLNGPTRANASARISIVPLLQPAKVSRESPASPTFVRWPNTASSSGVGAKRRELQLELVVPPHVVRVEEREQFSAREADPAVEGGCHAERRLRDITHTRTECLRDLGGRVGRAVVHHDHLEGRARLPEHALDRLRQELLAVPDRNDDADVHAGVRSRSCLGRPRRRWASRARRRRESDRAAAAPACPCTC